MEEERSEQCDVEDFLQRAALPLLFYAKKAKNEINSEKTDKTHKAEGQAEEEAGQSGYASDEAKEAASALLCIRLLAQQLQSMASSANSSVMAQENSSSNVDAEEVASRPCAEHLPSAAGGRRMAPELEDLALALAHWVSTEWCSPRIEVVAAWHWHETSGGYWC